MALPTGTSLPPAPYAVTLLILVGLVAWRLFVTRPPVRERTVVAFAPWMGLGAALHALYQLSVELGAIAPLLGTPAVYLTTFCLGGATWLALEHLEGDADIPLATGGGVAFAVAAGSVLTVGDTFALFWPGVIVSLAAVLTVGGILFFRQYRPDLLSPAPVLAGLVLFSHALDGVSTAVGYDRLPTFEERTPLSRLILEFAEGLPTADLLGAGWLFVLVKLGIAGLVIALFAEYVREEPARGFLALGFIAAVGLGPGVQNLLLFAVTAL